MNQTTRTDPRDLQTHDLQPPAEAPPPHDGAPRQQGPAAPAPPAPPRRRPRRRFWPWLIFGALLIVIFVAYRDCTAASHNQAAKPTAPPPAAITAAAAKTGDINIYIQALGTVTPVNTVTVYSQITGRVTGVYYREGQMVKKGDALVDIDPRPYQAQLTQSEGTLQHDEGLLAEARIDLARYQAALARNAIARQQVEDQAQLVVQYEGSVKADQGGVDYYKTQLSYCHIVAPIDGRVGLRLVDPGNTVFAGSASTLVVITQLQPITVVFNVSEDDLPQVEAQLRGGHSLIVAAFDRSDEKQIDAGRLTSLDNQVDTTTGTVKFRAEFPNPHLTLFPNQFVNARLLLKTLRRATLAPTAAVQHNGTEAFVYAIQNGKTAAVQPVNVLTSNENETAVTGIEPGTEIATSGFDRLENGAEVAIRGQPEPNAKAAPSAASPAKGGKSKNGQSKK